MKKLHNEFTFNLEKIESREKHLNNELSALIKQFKEVSMELTGVQFASKQVSQDSEALTAELITVVQENENKKAKMEQRGQLMSDGSKFDDPCTSKPYQISYIFRFCGAYKKGNFKIKRGHFSFKFRDWSTGTCI